jgi:hypothetical protein
VAHDGQCQKVGFVCPLFTPLLPLHHDHQATSEWRTTIANGTRAKTNGTRGTRAGIIQTTEAIHDTEKMTTRATGSEGSTMTGYAQASARSRAVQMTRRRGTRDTLETTATTTRAMGEGPMAGMVDTTKITTTVTKIGQLAGVLAGTTRNASCPPSPAPTSSSSVWTQTSQRPMSVDSHVLCLRSIR